MVRPALSLSFVLVATLFGCSKEATMQVNNAGSTSSYTETVEGGSSAGLGTLRLKADVCKDIDIKPDYTTLDEKSLINFLKTQGFETRVERARADLVYVDVTNAGTKEPARLRVAILKSAHDAGNELHEAILQHGPGSWGVHRSNLAVLAPVAETRDAIAFAVKTKLACWGVLTLADLDDTFVVAGGYGEL